MKNKTPKKGKNLLIFAMLCIALIFLIFSRLSITAAKEVIYKNPREKELLEGIKHVDPNGKEKPTFEGRGIMRTMGEFPATFSAYLEGTDGVDRVRVKDGFIWIETWNGPIDENGNPSINTEKIYDPIKKIGWRRATTDNANRQDDPGEPKDRRIDIHCGKIEHITILLKGGKDIALDTPKCDGFTANKKMKVEETFKGVKRTVIKTIQTNPKKYTYAEGGTGDDKISVGHGGSTIYGDEGKDAIPAGDGGNDIINAGNGKNSIWGGGGDDTITSGNSPDFINSGKGKDKITSGDEEETEKVKGKNEFKKGDTITGGKGDDTITAGKGNDLVCGGPGEDTINGGDGADTIRGGEDKDDIDTGKEAKSDDEFDKAQGDEPVALSEEDTVIGCKKKPDNCNKDVLFSPIIFKDSELKADCPDIIEVGQRPPEVSHPDEPRPPILGDEPPQQV